ncbi:lysophospholipid acyltransferase family protein [Haliangium ochraceum]|uniref:Phospholipid/glycerol acyltransferase n=1 Tax=Haliangium ochraceum (strain DSM 14365 / JCM 11303 / SMP-2) TaxID=502025 RepID=D0LTM3_HALO1|nr:lysophospholipid acyltransferase family protein [Haliangium ochraceum]ACY15717.1 phospholipid/glycerol acyltransferase [Haliangium ochraceum DSM 14365]
MSKKILGDNPFDAAPAAPAPTREEPAAAPAEAAAQPADPAEPSPDEAASAQRAASAAADAPTSADAEPAAGDADANVDERAEDREAIPDAADLDGELDDELAAADAEDFFLGGEAAVPPGEYGPPIVSVLPSSSERSSEFRELERRMMARSNPAVPIQHRRHLPMGFLWKRYRRFAMRNRAAQVDDFGRDPVYAARLQTLLDFLYTRYFRVQTSGIENVPGSGRALLVANHSGMLPYDGTMVMHAVHREHAARRDVRPLFADFVFHFPFLGTFINRIGGVRACQSNAERLLQRDEIIVVFPEGLKGVSKLYRQRYRLQRFGRGGFVKLALRTRAPIIPVAITGAEEAHPLLAKINWPSGAVGLPYLPVTPTFPLLGPLGLMPLPSRWQIRFGTPLDVGRDYSPEAADDRILVNRLTDTVRSRIQGMVDDLLAERKSVLFG